MVHIWTDSQVKHLFANSAEGRLLNVCMFKISSEILLLFTLYKDSDLLAPCTTGPLAHWTNETNDSTYPSGA